MNILHIKYACEVARLGSMGRAAEVLLVAQPNISRSIKELEGDLGITIFNRSAKGMELTADGAEFIASAERILKAIDSLELVYKEGQASKARFSVSVPRACYISEAFAEFSRGLSGSCEIIYKETNSKRTIQNVLSGDYKMGIIRYAESYDKQFKTMLEEKGLAYEMVAEFSYVLIANKNSPIARLENLEVGMLSKYMEIAHPDPYVPSLPAATVAREELSDNVERRIFVFERASQFEVLAKNPDTFMWMSPPDREMLDRYGLISLECRGSHKLYKDLLIYRKGYNLTKLDRDFITLLCEAKRKRNM